MNPTEIESDIRALESTGLRFHGNCVEPVPASKERRIRIQWKPNIVGSERRICLTRIRWENGTPGDGKGYSSKLSVSLVFEPRDIWMGLYWNKPSQRECAAWMCLIPCFPIRIQLLKSYGGRFP